MTLPYGLFERSVDNYLALLYIRLSPADYVFRHREDPDNMSQLPTITSTTMYTTMSVSMANRFTEITNYTTTVTDTVSYTQYDHSMPSSRPIPTKVTVEDDVRTIVVLQVPMTCNNLRNYYHGRWTEHIVGSKNMIDDLKPNPDIAGAGVREPLPYTTHVKC